MYAERRAQIALGRSLKSIFEDQSLWANPFTVLGRSAWGPNFNQDPPYIFIVNSDPAPDFQVEHLPVLVVETKLDIYPLEMGGGTYGLMTFAYHVFAKDGASRDDIAGSIMANQREVTIRDFGKPGEPVLETQRLIGNRDGAIWTTTPVSYSPLAPEWYSEFVRSGRILSSSFLVLNL